MEQHEYANLQQRHDELTRSAEILEDRIYACKNELDLLALRANFREVIQEKETIYEQLIGVKS